MIIPTTPNYYYPISNKLGNFERITLGFLAICCLTMTLFSIIRLLNKKDETK